MTELTIRPDEIRDAIEKYVSSYTADTTREEVGRVLETGDGIARVEGLQSTMTNELLEFHGGVLGIALNLDEREIGCVILGDATHIEVPPTVAAAGADAVVEWLNRVLVGGHAMIAYEIEIGAVTSE